VRPPSSISSSIGTPESTERGSKGLSTRGF
jgi:hypothetical protein